jgi:post-segregation antitoxin (ccd killing protein)
MMTFRKLSAASKGSLLRAYFTENTPEPIHDPGLAAGQQLDAGGRLTAYYTGRDSRATWRPDMPLAAAQALGIDPTRMPRDQELERLFEAKRADTGEAWSKHQRTVSAYDFTFSPHKSVTLAAEFAQTPAESAAIWNAIDRANDAAMRYVARELGWARKGKGGEDGAEPGAVGWVSFRHHTARPTLPVQDGPDGATYLAEAPVGGDPHAHVHNALFNVVATEDGHIGSLDTQRLHARVHEFGAYGQARLADELRRLGIRIAYDKNEQAVVVEAIPQHANEAFSKSSKQVLRGAKAFAAEQGLDWNQLPAEKKFEILRETGMAERLAKNAGKTDRELWREQSEAIGWAHKTVLEEVQHQPRTDSERFDLAYAFAARHLESEFHTAAVLDHDKLRLHAARGLIGTGISGPDDIDRVVELLESRGIELRGEHVALIVSMTDEKVQVTNTAQVRIEERLAEEAKAAALDRSGALSTRAIQAAVARSGLDFTTDPEHGRAQLAAIHALGEGGALTLLTGVAGSGKTTLLQPLVAAWQADTRYDAGGREVVGMATAWRQADALRDAGIDRTLPLQPMLAAIESGEFQPTRNTVLVIDEVSQVGPRPMLALLELQARTGMTIKALGDREQAQAIEAGDTIEIMRRALPKEALPELLSTVRQETERGRVIAGLFRGTDLGPYATLKQRQEHRVGEVTTALNMKRHDGTAMLAGGDHDQVVGRIADLYMQRLDHLEASGTRRTITVSVPTNGDAADVSRAIRTRLKARGRIGADEVTYKAIDQRGETYDLPVATGDRLRLYRRTWARIDGRGGSIGNNGDVVEVVGRTENGLQLRDKTGRVGEVEWRRMSDTKTGRLLLGFGHALTIDAAQGITSGEHINALPRGTAGLTAFKAYVAESRSRGATWTVISEAAVHDAERRSRALGDASPVTAADLWSRVVRDMASKPYKALATDLAGSARADRNRAVDTFIRQSHRLQAMEAGGRDPGQEARRHVRDLSASREVASSQVALGGALRGVDAGLAGVGREVAVHERGQRVRAFMQQQAAGTLPGAGSDTGVRRVAQAEAVRKQLARHLVGLDEALRRNDQSLRGLGQDVTAHLQGTRNEAAAAQRELEKAVRRPSSPTPGM